jgi:hypothetical protein
MTEHERELAEHCFGYGRWDAPYWFIGPEQGQGLWEGGKLDRRYLAFKELGRDGLCHCLKFHDHIGETQWRGKLQTTWRRLILLLKAYQGVSTEDSELLSYQRTAWGSTDEDGETCFIEISGLPANNLKIPRDREIFRDARIRHIVEIARHTQPEFIVIYGKSQWKYWKDIAATEASLNIQFERHPVRGPAKPYWIDKGANYRAAQYRTH